MKAKIEAGQATTPEVRHLRNRLTPRNSDNSRSRSKKLEQHNVNVPAFGKQDGQINLQGRRNQVNHDDEEPFNKPQIN